MQIILLTDGIYPYVMGGMQKHSYYMAKYLTRNKVYVELYHCVPQGESLIDKLKGFTDEELRYISHHCFHFPVLGKLPGHYIRENKKLSERYLNHYNSNPQILKSSNPQIIYAQGFTAHAFIEVKKQGIQLPPIFVNFHGLEMFQKAPSLRVKFEHLILRSAVRYNIRNADATISLGGKLAEILTNEKARRVIETPIGIEKIWLINQDDVLQNDNNRRFVFIGRYERRKGIEELNEVLKRLSVKNNFEFHFIGPILKEKQLGRNNIIYHGLIKDENRIKEILQSSDVIVSPSWSEGMPTVILEAMASGCAIIATNVGAVSVQIDESNGWLISPGNKKELKKVIIDALNISNDRLQQMKQNSVKKIKEQFLWDDVIKKVITALTDNK